MEDFLESGVKAGLPLTKFYDPADMRTLAIQIALAVVDKHFESASPQHPLRRWEYAMGLTASIAWKRRRPASWADIGGAGSPFARMLEEDVSDQGIVVDPSLPGGMPLLDWVAAGGKAEQVYCISVIEHVEDLSGFLRDLAEAVIPGGMLFMTADAWEPSVNQQNDTAHFHWMRKRIFTPKSWAGVIEALGAKGLETFGGVDLKYQGNWVYDYSFVSLAMRKKA